jgi:oxygen-dependent protoporphyrinogen oxidase
MANVVVIGGGISGLSCALNLVDRRPDLCVRVLEASDRLGGTIHTDRHNGFVCETGPGAYIDRHPSTRRLIERLGLAGEVVAAGNAVRRRYIRHDGQLHRYPDCPEALAQSQLLSEHGRKRMLLAPISAAIGEGEDWTVSKFARTHLGAEAATMLLDPIVRGIYAGDADTLSAASVLPQLVGLAKSGGRVCDALLGQGQGRIGKGSMVSLAKGLGQMVDALGQTLSDVVQTHSPVQSISRHGSGWQVRVGGQHPEVINADAVICTVHGKAAVELLGPSSPELEGLLETIPSPPVVVVNLGFAAQDITHPLDGFGYLVPSTEGGPVLGVKWTTSIFPTGRAPAGHRLMQVFLGGSQDASTAALPPEAQIALATSELRQTLGVMAEPVHTRVHTHRSGIPQYTVGHAARTRQIERVLAQLPGLYLGGTSMHGVGINACTTSAELLARAVADSLPHAQGTLRLAPAQA